MKQRSLTQEQLNIWVIEAKKQAKTGQLPKYIPRLAAANPDWFAIQIELMGDRIYTNGDKNLSFPLMSVIKPFILLYLLEQLGAEMVFSHVGVESSSEPFNSLAQLQADRGFPRNPMINSGAIALSSLVPGENAASRCEHLRQWLARKAKCNLFLDQLTLASVRSLPNERNRAIANELFRSGHLETPPTVALDTYEQVCCLSGTVADLTRLGMLLVDSREGINPDNSRIVKEIMTSCGLYEHSGRFAVEIGLPTKSGVSGAMLSVVPGEGAIASYSPPLDSVGNSVAGLFLLEQLSIFN